MSRAIALAQQHRPHPNPRVGAVLIAKDGSVAGEGSHAGPGHKHAEVVALDQAGAAAVGATIYVTLEPCTHHGRTPPCVDALIEAKVSRVVVGSLDPDSKVHGTGVDRLRDSGIEVTISDDTESARSVDPAYFHHRKTGLPRVTLKYAMTLDGSAAAADRSSQWITSEEARSDAHIIRSRVDGVVIGAGTLRADDPLLTVRTPAIEGSQPIPIVVAGTGSLPSQAKLWARRPVVVSAGPMTTPNATTLLVAGADGLPDPTKTVVALADELGMLDLLLEGGPTLAGAWWRASVITRVVVYVGGRVGGGAGIQPLGGIFESIDLADDVVVTSVRTLGPDIRIDYEKR